MRNLVIAVVLIWLRALTSTVQAGGAYGTPTPMQVTLEREPVDYAQPRYRALVTADTNKLAFLVPGGWRVAGDPASGMVTLANLEGNLAITFSISEATPSEGSLSPDDFRESVLRQHANAKIVREFSRTVASRSGPGFDLQWKASGQVVQCKRVVYIPSALGMLVFTATSSQTNFPALQYDLDTILASFQYSTNGKLHVVHLSNQS